jgi:hypothetical protein
MKTKNKLGVLSLSVLTIGVAGLVYSGNMGIDMYKESRQRYDLTDSVKYQLQS